MQLDWEVDLLYVVDQSLVLDLLELVIRRVFYKERTRYPLPVGLSDEEAEQLPAPLFFLRDPDPEPKLRLEFVHHLAKTNGHLVGYCNWKYMGLLLALYHLTKVTLHK